MSAQRGFLAVCNFGGMGGGGGEGCGCLDLQATVLNQSFKFKTFKNIQKHSNSRYDVNWDAAGFLDWGFGAGCAFALSTCDAYAAAVPGQQWFCRREDYAPTTNSVCTFDGLARAKCEDTQFADGCIMKVCAAVAA